MGAIHGIANQGNGWEDIGTHGLRGRVSSDDKFITVTGPCGEGHTMSLEAAAELCAWLSGRLVERGVILADPAPRIIDCMEDSDHTWRVGQ